MTDEIKALREEIAMLRERVAVLEARPQVANPRIEYRPAPFSDQYQPTWVNPAPNSSPYVLPTVICSAALAAPRSEGGEQ